MKTSMHFLQRQNQRGVSMAMVDYVIEHGTPERDRVIMGKKDALRKLEMLQEEQRLLKKILDKGGVVVVADGETLITTYNFQHRAH